MKRSLPLSIPSVSPTAGYRIMIAIFLYDLILLIKTHLQKYKILHRVQGMELGDEINPFLMSKEGV